MKIGGLQKTSMIDFPGTVSAVVFTIGCNFTCPYCHNPQLAGAAPKTADVPDIEEVFRFLQKRRNVLGGVVISGGEPTLQGDALFAFCQRLKSQGHKVKLDTNGSSPQILRELLKLRLLDYVAMDLKADPFSYPREICAEEPAGRIPESIEILSGSGIAHEFRVTCAHPFVTSESFDAILKAAGKSVKIFLQALNLNSVLNPGFFTMHGPGRPLNAAEIDALLAQGVTGGHLCHIR